MIPVRVATTTGLRKNIAGIIIRDFLKSDENTDFLETQIRILEDNMWL